MKNITTGILCAMFAAVLPLAGCSAADGSVDPAESEAADPLAGAESFDSIEQALNGEFRITLRRVSNVCLKRDGSQVVGASCGLTPDFLFTYNTATKELVNKETGQCVGTPSGTNTPENLALSNCAGRNDQKWTFLAPTKVKINTWNTRTVQRIQNDLGLLIRLPDSRIGSAAMATGWSRSAYVDYDWMQLN
jgi:Ricin-type beta-trefoil lectin domain